jgi:hypothetical protein
MRPEKEMKMANAPSNQSPQVYARIAGALYLVLIVAGGWAEVFVRGRIIVSGDAVTTAHNIVASQSLWRASIAADLVMHLCDVVVMTVFYLLFKTVNRNLALSVLLFNVVQTAVLVANKTLLVLPLFLLSGAAYLQAWTPQQLYGLSYVCLRAHGHGFGIGLIFFGAVCLLEGHLIRRSGFLPKTLGFLMQAAGVCYLLNSFALLLAPGLAAMLFPAVMLPPIIAESSLALWLLVKGVDLAKWEERLRIAG